jgi:hypothetical protein
MAAIGIREVVYQMVTPLADTVVFLAIQGSSI